MPRRNLILLYVVALISLVCYQRVQHNSYGRVLGDVISEIQRISLEPPQTSELFEAAMGGMIGRLDEYSAYVRPVDKEKFFEVIDQQFAGIGMEIGLDPKTKQLTVMCPLVNSPAYVAGIRAGDRILRIDGAGTQGMSLKDAIGLLRGESGVAVTLTVQHPEEKTPVDIRIVRAVIQMDTVMGDTRNADGSWNFFLDGHDHIGYVRITSFAEQTAGELERAMKWLTERHMRGLVLDLRDDPGGLLGSAIAVGNQFIRSGSIVSIRRRNGRITQAYQADGSGMWLDFPMAVLVDGNTASAAEIVAACLQDHHRAVIVGQRTFGKGTVQELIDLDDACGAMKITTASYWRPNGHNIHRLRTAKDTDEWGVKPDEGFQVSVPEAELEKLQLQRIERDTFQPKGSSKPQSEMVVDPQLAKALDYVEQESSKKAEKETPVDPPATTAFDASAQHDP
jgi:carboxyl-terminal processing protease